MIGIPTRAQGNVSEVATGQVNVDEACSGIRSFQATLMISLFLGELYQLTVGRRAVCLVAGFLLALLLNLARLLVLVWVATRQGIPAISRWHDPTGVLILLGCFSALWFIGQWLARGNPPSAHRPPATEHRPSSPTRSTLHASSSNRLAFALLAWIGLVEFAVSGWYAWRDSESSPNACWQVAWPTNVASFTTIPIPAATGGLLRFDDGLHAAWNDSAGRRWEAFYLHWNPGRTAGYLSKLHTPQACLPAAGLALVQGPEPITLSAGWLQLPFQRYVFTAQQNPLDVFYCRWPDRGRPGQSLVGQSSWADRLRNVWEGRGNTGQRVLEMVLWNNPGASSAPAVVETWLGKLIVPVQ